MVDFVWIPIIPMTILLGIVQLIFIHKDEPFRGSHWFSHGFHILILMPIFLFVVFNVQAAVSLVGLPLDAWYTNEILVRAIVALVFGIKSYGLSAVAKGGASGKGMHESFLHVIIMMALVFASPFVWPLVEPALPSWAK